MLCAGTLNKTIANIYLTIHVRVRVYNEVFKKASDHCKIRFDLIWQSGKTGTVFERREKVK